MIELKTKEDYLNSGFKDQTVTNILIDEETEEQDLRYFIGGYLYIVESVEDLKEISYYDFKDDTEYNMFEKFNTEPFDIFDRLNKDYWVLSMITNDAGGNIYYIHDTIISIYNEVLGK